MSSNKIKSFNQNRDLCFWSMIWGWIPSVWRAVLSLFYPPVIIWGKNGKNSENPVGSNKSEKRKPKSAVYRRILASVVYFHLRIISAKNHKRKMTRNQLYLTVPWVRIPPAPPRRVDKKDVNPFFLVFMRVCGLLDGKSGKRFYRGCPRQNPQRNPTSGASAWFFRPEAPLFCVLRPFSPLSNL